MDNVEKSLNGSKGTGDKMCMEARQKKAKDGEKTKGTGGKTQRTCQTSEKGESLFGGKVC